MGWLIVVLGVALSAVGAIAGYFGWDVMLRDERGSQLLVSGSVGLSGGIVTIALGLVLFKLSGMRRDLAKVLRERTDAAPALSEKPANPAAAEPERVPERKRRKDLSAKEPAAKDLAAKDLAAKDLAAKDAAARDLAASAETDLPVRSAPTVAFSPTLDSGATLAGVAATGMASVEDLTAAAVAHAVRPSPIRPAAPPEAPPALPEALPFTPAASLEPDPLPPPDAAPIPQPEPAPKPTEMPWEPVAQNAPFSYDRFEEELAKLDQVEAAAAAPQREEPVPEAPKDAGPTAPPAEESAPPARPKSAIVGQYEAGGVSYIMYADGSIEAETPNGVYRFLDINELKAFIQSQASS